LREVICLKWSLENIENSNLSSFSKQDVVLEIGAEQQDEAEKAVNMKLSRCL
jgi:hypothetical protein